MKRGSIILLVVFLFSIFFIHFSTSEDINSVVGQIEGKADQIENTLEKVDNAVNDPLKTREELRREYLKVEWDKILRSKPVIGQIIVAYEKVSPYTDPIIGYAVGMKPNLSWYFLLLFVIWIILVKYFYTFYEVLRDFSTFSNIASAVISTCFFVILLVLQFFQSISKFLADKIVAAIGLLDNTFVQVAIVIVGILLIIILGKFSKSIKDVAKKTRIEAYKKNALEEMKMETQRAKRMNDALSEVFSDGSGI